MSHVLTNYNDTGILICTNRNGSEKGISEAGLALNSNFKELIDAIDAVQTAITAVQAVLATLVPYTGASEDVDLGSHAISANAGSFAGGAITLGDNSGTAAYVDSDGGLMAIGGYMYLQNQYGWVPSIGFNSYFDSGSWHYGPNSSNNYASLLQGDATDGNVSLLISAATGNAGDSISWSSGLLITPDGRLLVSDAADDSVSSVIANSASFASGAITIGHTTGTAAWINNDGTASFDSGKITTDGVGTLRLHAQGSPPAAVAGGIYFDGTNFNFCADGMTWVALTLP